MAMQEQNYWPGFVDALSNVVLTLIFVLVVFVLALVITSNKVEKKAMELIVQAKEQKAGGGQAIDLKVKLDAAEAKIKELEKEKKVLVEYQDIIEKDFVSSKVGEQIRSNLIMIARKKDRILLTYPEDIAALDDRALGKLDSVMDKVKEKLIGHNIVIRSYIGKEPYTSARRLAYYRILNVRNRLLSNGYATGRAIDSHIMERTEEKVGRVEIIFK